MNKLTVVLRSISDEILVDEEIESLEDGVTKVIENTNKFRASAWHGNRYDKNENSIVVVKCNGIPIARYSYNGRLWEYENNDCPVEINENTLSVLISRVIR